MREEQEQRQRREGREAEAEEVVPVSLLQQPPLRFLPVVPLVALLLLLLLPPGLSQAPAAPVAKEGAVDEAEGEVLRGLLLLLLRLRPASSSSSLSSPRLAFLLLQPDSRQHQPSSLRLHLRTR